MLEAGRARGRPKDGDDVDAQGHPAGQVVVVVLPEPGEPAKAALLGPRHRLERRAEGLARAGLDLADDQLPAVDGDDVHLAPATAPVAVENGQALRQQVAARETFAVVAQGAGGELHAYQPRGTGPGRTPVIARLWTAYAIGRGLWRSGAA